jgi:hypothetical protein
MRRECPHEAGSRASSRVFRPKGCKDISSVEDDHSSRLEAHNRSKLNLFHYSIESESLFLPFVPFNTFKTSRRLLACFATARVKIGKL